MRAFELLDKWKNCDRHKPFRFRRPEREFAAVTPGLWGKALSMRRTSSVQRTKAFLPSWRPAHCRRRHSDAFGNSCTGAAPEVGRGMGLTQHEVAAVLGWTTGAPCRLQQDFTLYFIRLSQADMDYTDSSNTSCQDFRLINPIARGQEEVERGSRAGLDGFKLFKPTWPEPRFEDFPRGQRTMCRLSRVDVMPYVQATP